MSKTNHPTSTIAKRTECARRIVACAAEAGWTLAYDETRDSTRFLDFASGDFRLRIGLSPSWPGAFLGHWNIASRSDAAYPGWFPAAHVNAITWAQATTCEDNFDRFLLALARGFAALAQEAAWQAAEATAACAT